MDAPVVWLNDRLEPASVAHVSVSDRGFQLGDGVFETLRACSGRPVELAEHVDRLLHSLGVMAIGVPRDLAPQLGDAIHAVLAANDLGGPRADAAVRVTISRGAAPGRGVLPPEGMVATILVQAWPVEPAPAGVLHDGLRVVVSSIRRDPESPMAAVKSTSRADTVFARLEARRAGADDAVFLTLDGYLAEATSANLFVVRDGRLRTPALSCGILAGTTRAWLLNWGAAVALDPEEGLLTTRDFAEATEAFVSSSIAGVLPVTRFERRPIGDGRPGPWTQRARADREACFR